jgi:cysteinyl-tRNA synthetase
MCAQYVSDITGAFDDDLDTPAALRGLRELEKDDAIPPGSKFETFAHADRLFGLDLARDVGQPARAALGTGG